MLTDDSGSEHDQLRDDDDIATDMYISSESEVEDFGDDSADREWRFKVVGEEVTNNNESIYEVSWPDWHRQDGTNNTWMRKADMNPQDLSEEWDKIVAAQLKGLTKKSLAIGVWPHTDVLSTNTRLRAQAYTEKAKIRGRPSEKVALVERKETLLKKRQAEDGEDESSPEVSDIDVSLTAHRPSRSRTRAGSSMSVDQRNRRETPGQRGLSVLSSSSSDFFFPTPTSTTFGTSSRRSSSMKSPKRTVSAVSSPPLTSRSSRSSVSIDKSNSRPFSSSATADPDATISFLSSSSFTFQNDQLATGASSSRSPSVASTSAPSKSRRSTTLSSVSSLPKGKEPHLQDDKLDITRTLMLDHEERILSSNYGRSNMQISDVGSSFSSFRVAGSSYKAPSLPLHGLSESSSSPKKREKIGSFSSSAKGKERERITVSSIPSPISTSSSSVKGKRHQEKPSLFGSPPPYSSASSSSYKGKGREITASTTTRPQKPLPHRARLSRSQNMSIEWSSAAKEAGAAKITVVNDVDEEDGPDITDGFEYLESSYSFTALDDYNPTPPELFIRCECDTCMLPSHCDCQGVSDLCDENNERVFAYTSEGLFAFNVPPGIEVIECNSQCQCNLDCLNRVAQRPRSVPIEIFKTRHRGWGVRSSVNVEHGKVIGLYTGQLIRREDAEALSGDLKIYCFDLDGRDDPDGEITADVYSVDSRTCGNWTRFLNHSCEPNLLVYNAVWNTIPESNIPYLVFVALQDIPAGMEFTFDYNPAENLKPLKGRGKNKVKKPPGARDCVCGAERCRGWV